MTILTLPAQTASLPYPWLKRYAEQLLPQKNRWAHAWLLHGAEGIGKYAFARWMSHVLLCEKPDHLNQPCGVCTSCTWLSEHRHPDFLSCLPDNIEDPRFHFLSYAECEWIKLDRLRALQQRIYIPPHRQRAKVVVIYPAELLNTAASNALLKLLEEPPSDTTFILITHHADQLLPTIKSRCTSLMLSAHFSKQVEQWCTQQAISVELLALAGFSPLKALAMGTSYDHYKTMIEQLLYPSRIDVDTWKTWLDKQPKNERRAAFSNMQDFIYKILHDFLFAYYGWTPRFFPSYLQLINQQINKISIPKLLNLVHDLNTVRQHSKHPLNPTWGLEDLILRYSGLWS